MRVSAQSFRKRNPLKSQRGAAPVISSINSRRQNESFEAAAPRAFPPFSYTTSARFEFPLTIQRRRARARQCKTSFNDGGSDSHEGLLSWSCLQFPQKDRARLCCLEGLLFTGASMGPLDATLRSARIRALAQSRKFGFSNRRVAIRPPIGRSEELIDLRRAPYRFYP